MKIIYLVILCSISGLLTAFITSYRFGNDLIDLARLFFIPGTIYGVALSIFLFFERRSKLIDLLVLISYSTIAWFVAYLLGTTLHLFGIVAGLAGSFIIVKTIEKIVPLKHYNLIIICGGILGIYTYHMFRFTYPDGSLQQLSLGFIVWQVGVGLAIYLSMKKVSNQHN